MKTSYFQNLNSLFAKIKVSTNEGKALSFDRAQAGIKDLLISQSAKGNKIMLIGNGGSAAIADHIATDFLKNCAISAITFNDSSILTSIGNDFGYQRVFERPIEGLARAGDILFSISSSGKSENILRATKKAEAKGCFVITFSGFGKNNPLRKLGEVNFYVPSKIYGHVEIVHLGICHLIADNVKK